LIKESPRTYAGNECEKALEHFERSEEMANRYDDRERFEGGRNQDAGRRGEFERGYQNRGSEQGARGGWSGGETRNEMWNPASEGSYGDYEGRGNEIRGENYENRYGNERGFRGNDYRGNEPWGNEGRYGNQPQFEEGYRRGFGGSGPGAYYQGSSRNFSGNRQFNDAQSGQDWDRYRQRSMTTTYPRQDEWSSGHGVSAGLGGAENSEYSSYPRGGSYYSGQGQLGGGLGQFGEGQFGGNPGHLSGGLAQYGEQQRQHHVGRGPKGYKRSDERIREDVNERLTQDPEIDASEIEVQVKGGEVMLIGIVEMRYAKRRAEDLIESISGVREVHNQLRTRSGHETRSANELGGSEGSSAGKQVGQSREMAAKT
jgi:osmotically-inducible protein OsmY